MRSVHITISLIVFLLGGNLCSALSPVNKSIVGGIAIKGYDPVSYFTTQKATKGNKKFEFKYNGAKWRFASQENLDLFKADPEKYAPQYGGYCAWAVANGQTANIDPKAWKIVNGKLYLNYDTTVQKRWERNARVNIGMADSHWPVLLRK